MGFFFVQNTKALDLEIQTLQFRVNLFLILGQKKSKKNLKVFSASFYKGASSRSNQIRRTKRKSYFATNRIFLLWRAGFGIPTTDIKKIEKLKLIRYLDNQNNSLQRKEKQEFSISYLYSCECIANIYKLFINNILIYQ